MHHGFALAVVRVTLQESLRTCTSVDICIVDKPAVLLSRVLLYFMIACDGGASISTSSISHMPVHEHCGASSLHLLSHVAVFAPIWHLLSHCVGSCILHLKAKSLCDFSDRSKAVCISRPLLSVVMPPERILTKPLQYVLVHL